MRALRFFLRPAGRKVRFPFLNLGHLPVIFGSFLGTPSSPEPLPVPELLLSVELVLEVELEELVLSVLEVVVVEVEVVPGLEFVADVLVSPGVVPLSGRSALVSALSGALVVVSASPLAPPAVLVADSLGDFSLGSHADSARDQLMVPTSRILRDAENERAFDFMNKSLP